MLLRRLILTAVIVYRPLDSPAKIIRDRYRYSAIGYLQAIRHVHNYLWVKVQEEEEEDEEVFLTTGILLPK